MSGILFPLSLCQIWPKPITPSLPHSSDQHLQSVPYVNTCQTHPSLLTFIELSGDPTVNSMRKPIRIKQGVLCKQNRNIATSKHVTCHVTQRQVPNRALQSPAGKENDEARRRNFVLCVRFPVENRDAEVLVPSITLQTVQTVHFKKWRSLSRVGPPWPHFGCIMPKYNALQSMGRVRNLQGGLYSSVIWLQFTTLTRFKTPRQLNWRKRKISNV